MEEPFMIEKLIANALNEAKGHFEGTEEEFNAHFESKLPEVIKSVTTLVMDEVFRYCTSNTSDLKKWDRKIKRRISRRHHSGLKLFAAFIELNHKISSGTYYKFHQQFNEFNDQLKLDILIANHVRACQIANEVRVLVANGYADGAHARWRTLHEICVTFLFLYDNDYQTVQMYNDYEVIEKWKKAKEYRETYEQLNFEPLEETEWQALELDRQTLLDKYGKDFGDSYGWFINHMPKGRRNFKELEKLAGQNHFRAVYGWANENVHAGVSGVKERLGLREQDQHHFLIGPSDYGFLDPIQYTAASLAEMSHTLLAMEDSLMNSILAESLTFFQKELINEFDKSES
jgi:hypothetical protein